MRLKHELITLMDKNGIGTDATIHEHIKHIQDRGYAQRFGMIFTAISYFFAIVSSTRSLQRAKSLM